MNAARLRLCQLVSPALPVGAFSYSEGLEVLVQTGRLADGAAVAAWLEAELHGGSLPIEAATLPRLMEALALWRRAAGAGGPEPADPAAAATAIPAATAATAAAALAGLVDLDGWLLAQREAAEVRAQQRQMGRSLLQLLADLGWPLPPGPLPSGPPPLLAWPAAWAWAGLCLELAPLEVVEAYLYGWVANQLSAAVRLVPLGPTEAQRQQLALAPRIARRAAELVAADPADLWNGGVGAGLAQLGHGELYSRLFRS